MKPIETVYKGYRFRSRLEARWAVFFDALGIRWEYEVDGFNLGRAWYLPDFWMPTLDCWIEIKGQWPTRIEKDKARLLALGTGKKVYIFPGGIWIPGTPESYHIDFGEYERYQPKGFFGFDASCISIYGYDPTSPCIRNRGCKHLNCPNEIQIELGQGYDHLIKALYLAEFSLESDGDSCKLCRTARGDLVFLAPDCRLLPYDAPPPQNQVKGKANYIAIPLPQSIKEHEKELKQLLLSKPANWVWKIGAVDGLYSNGEYRWYECDTCEKICIALSGKDWNMACYKQHDEEASKRLNDGGYPDVGPEGSDETPRLIAAYTKARQARFEHGENGMQRRIE